ncbi:hypothetical protein M569_04816 [Genlisea aurea]|uniref:PROP1-like PPR domain-containing protein n=1 Tax=Genlisea aurea TaxID=192259 RepID=S8CSX8_9LAMI|nr:hypothetical protein M569_04816 [Genlisea aurea]
MRAGFRRTFGILSTHFLLAKPITAPHLVTLSGRFRRLLHTPCCFSGPSYRTNGGFTDFLLRDVNLQLCDRIVVERIQKAKYFASGNEALAFLDDSGVKPDADLVVSLIWELKQDWKLAFLVYKWGEKWDCIVEKVWCSMIWVLGSHRRFSTAWSLIRQLSDAAEDTQQAMLIVIDRYAAANQPEKAIRTFNLMQKFKYSPERASYLAFLDILCSHGNVEEAEDFMHLHKKFFPLEVESFNVILNGWCNGTAFFDIYEAKRVWREMSKCCIEPDKSSYAHMISGHARAGNLFDSLRLYDEMKKRGWVPGMQVYHSLVYVLSRENCLIEVFRILDRMKEMGMAPDRTTYGLIVCPLCDGGKFDSAKVALERMIGDGVDPGREIFHALLKGCESVEEAFGVLDRMREAGSNPNADTFSVLLRKFVGSGKDGSLARLWSEMTGRFGVEPDVAHGRIVVEGLVEGGLVGEAEEFYSAMKLDDPSLKNKLLQKKKKKKKVTAANTRYVKSGGGLRRWRGQIRIRKKKPIIFGFSI